MLIAIFVLSVISTMFIAFVGVTVVIEFKREIKVNRIPLYLEKATEEQLREELNYRKVYMYVKE